MSSYADAYVGRAGADHGRPVDHPAAKPLPERSSTRPESGSGRPRRLPRARRWRTHQLALQNVRRRCLWAADEHSLHGTGRAGGGADLDQTRLNGSNNRRDFGLSSTCWGSVGSPLPLHRMGGGHRAVFGGAAGNRTRDQRRQIALTCGFSTGEPGWLQENTGSYG